MSRKLFSVCLLLLIGVAGRGTTDAAWRCPAGGAGVIGAKPYQIEALNLHNQFRAKHDSPPLKMDSTLNAIAEQCAAYYAQKQYIDHTCPYKKDAGENLLAGNWTWSETQMGSLGPNGWYEEESLYPYYSQGFSEETGHFTQLVWKSSVKFGYAATTISGYTAAVGLYLPPGNDPYRFEENVMTGTY